MYTQEASAADLLCEDITDSSLITRVMYDPLMDMLVITFKNNQEYEYYEVPYEVFRDLTNEDCKSRGRYFIRNIKNTYEYSPRRINWADQEFIEKEE